MDLVFSNELGRPVEVSNLTYRYFRPLLMKAGLPQVRFHDLRHTAATLMLGAEVDVKLVSEMLGHSQTAFTRFCQNSGLSRHGGKLTQKLGPG